MPGLVWTHSVATAGEGLNFLDLFLKTRKSENCEWQISSALYRKPLFIPGYLHALSAHPAHMKASIVSGELRRIHVASSSKEAYFKACKLALNFFKVRGYYVTEDMIPVFDPEFRDRVLKRVYSKPFSSFSVGNLQGLRNGNSLKFILPWHPSFSQLRLSQLWQASMLETNCSLDLHFSQVWSISGNLFQRSYRGNF